MHVQLGLRLESRKVNSDVLVVDHAEKPSVAQLEGRPVPKSTGTAHGDAMPVR
jgi:hypothetical protein